MNAMINSLAKMNQINYVDVAGRLFAGGVNVGAWQSDRALGDLIRPGNIYGGFRNAPMGIADHPEFIAAAKILLVRDPRDALVSEYFSNAFSHSVPTRGESRDAILAERERALEACLEDYVMRMSAPMRSTLQQYAPFFDQPNMRVYKYEQAIMNKRWFLRDVCEHFGWKVTDHELGLIMSWADVIPDKENAAQFVRKVIPGDYLGKLSVETISKLNCELAPALDTFGYG